MERDEPFGFRIGAPSIIWWCLFAGAKNLDEFHPMRLDGEGGKDEDDGMKRIRRAAVSAVKRRRGARGGENATRAKSKEVVDDSNLS